MGELWSIMSTQVRRFLAVLAAALVPMSALAEGEAAGDFDYYVLALSWSPNWCSRTGDAQDSPQCAPRTGFGWILHGLWPQFEDGWPSYCRGSERNPSRAMTGAMADITGTGGLAWHAWNKHGRCSGLSAEAFFELSRQAYERVNRPEVLRELDAPVTLPSSVIEAAFLEANPNLSADGVTVTCADRQIAEVRICLTKKLEPRLCSTDVRRDCALDSALFEPLR